MCSCPTGHVVTGGREEENAVRERSFMGSLPRLSWIEQESDPGLLTFWAESFLIQRTVSHTVGPLVTSPSSRLLVCVLLMETYLNGTRPCQIDKAVNHWPFVFIGSLF